MNVDGLNCPLQFQGTAPTLSGGFPVNTCYRRQTTTAPGAVITSGPLQDVRGGVLPASPKWRASLGARYDHELRGLGVAAFAQVDANYTSRQQFAVEQDPLLIKKGYTLVDASVGVRDLSGRYMLTLFVRNLFDKSYETDLAHGSILLGAANFSDLYANFNKDARRYIGATLGVSF